MRRGIGIGHGHRIGIDGGLALTMDGGLALTMEIGTCCGESHSVAMQPCNKHIGKGLGGSRVECAQVVLHQVMVQNV